MSLLYLVQYKSSYTTYYSGMNGNCKIIDIFDADILVEIWFIAL